MFAIFKFFAALNSNTKPTEIAVGVAYGFWLALLPISSLFWLILLLVSSFFRINQAAVLLAAFLLKLVVGPFTALLDYVGWFVLDQDALYPFFTSLRNTPFIPWTKFYNSVVMGALLLGPFLAIPVGVFAYFSIKLYRLQVRDRFLRSRFVQFVWKLPLVRTLFDKYQKARDVISLFR